MVLLSGEYAF